MGIRDFLRTMVEKDASGPYLSCGTPASARIAGAMTRLNDTPLAPETVRAIGWSTMRSEQISEFEQRPEMNLAIPEEGICRSRVNIFRQRTACPW